MKDKLSREELIRGIKDWWREEENMKLGLLHALTFKGKDEKAKEVIKELGLRSQIVGSILSLLTLIPEEKLEEFVKKWTMQMITAFYASDIMHSIKELLKEYESLRGGKE